MGRYESQLVHRELLSLPEVAARCGGVDRSRVDDWIRRGVKVRGYRGPRVKLAAVELPRGRRVTREALEKFLQELAGAREAATGRSTGRGNGCLSIGLIREVERERAKSQIANEPIANQEGERVVIDGIVLFDPTGATPLQEIGRGTRGQGAGRAPSVRGGHLPRGGRAGRAGSAEGGLDLARGHGRRAPGMTLVPRG